MRKRCPWCGDDPLYVTYHDEDWGVPVHDDRKLLEMLVLEGAQAGLSWLTILRKRPAYRQAFDAFEARKIAGYSAKDVARLLADVGIVRNRLKIQSAIDNARGVLEIVEEFGTLDAFFWRYVDGIPQQNCWQSMTDIPARTETSERMSRDLKRRGFNFVGPTICYALMQSIGMVNDHLESCFRYQEVRRLGRQRP